MRKLKLSCVVFYSLLLFACNQSNAKKILGKWQGTLISSCDKGGVIPAKIQYIFSEEGKCTRALALFENQKIEESIPALLAYKLEGDDILINFGGVWKKSHIDFIHANDLLLSSEDVDDKSQIKCKSTTNLKRILE